MGLMSYAMIEALKAGKNSAYILEWTLADIVYRFSKDGSHTDDYPYPKRVITYGGPVGALVQLLAGRGITDYTRNIILDDGDGDITRIVLGENAEQIVGSSMTIKRLAEDVNEDSWYTSYTGNVFDYGKDGSKWVFICQPPQADRLNGRIRTPLIALYDFPDAEADSINEESPIIIGKNNSTGLGQRGMLPTHYVDTTNYLFLASHGTLPSGDYAVWDDETLQTETTDYTWETVLRSGRRYQIINMVAEPSGEIKFDAKGITDDGTAGGTVIINPAEQMKQILAHWVFDEIQDTENNMDIADDSSVDVYTFDIVGRFLDRCNATSSRRIDGSKKAKEILNEFVKNFNLFTYWTNLGKLALAHCDWIVDDIYDETFPVFWFGQMGVDEKLKYKSLSNRRFDEIAVKYMYNEASKKFLRQIRVKDPDYNLDASHPLQMFWAESQV
ncbi:MAG: hypothetical protein ACXACX_09285 [Candidatus Hodarchaeales archaeon]|jgi:hypothetical protein